MKLFYTLFISILLSVLVSCNNEEWISELPDNYNGYFTQINDTVIQGYEKPLRFEITKKYRKSSLQTMKISNIPLEK